MEWQSNNNYWTTKKEIKLIIDNIRQQTQVNPIDLYPGIILVWAQLMR